ncbi:gfo/Idh/MocA family oxidoreductase [Providencia stuartii]|uniref:Dehydrogenase n=2 Tax=Providencia stuartii TaxID=588 RepID=A0A346CLA3_PROST|nr:Gfo/Idh/MocA family oxidoreductase [Providencia stuartii]AXL96377.1 dehydrogenase [Providencia stuartii]MTC92144.1 gfo/Idh/MocA family oxidoreductase [Providencia stuartii]
MKHVAVIGLGNIANRHRRNLKLLFPNITISAMSASGRTPSEPISDCDYITTSLDELISSHVQLVIIASPAPYHSKHAIPLIKAKIPILIEKPVTSTLKDAEILEQISKQYNTPIAIGYCLRYLSSAQEMKKLIDSDIIGTLYYANIEIGQYLPDWRPNKNYHDCVSANSELGGGALLELSHEIDYTQWLLGSLNLKYAILQRSDELGLDVEDNVNILATAMRGTIVNIHLDFLQRKAYRQCRFVGSKGTLEWNLINNEIRLISNNSTNILYSVPEWDKNQMYLDMIIDFINKINNKKNQSITLSEAIETLTLIEQIKSKYPITKTSTIFNKE